MDCWRLTVHSKLPSFCHVLCCFQVWSYSSQPVKDGMWTSHKGCFFFLKHAGLGVLVFMSDSRIQYEVNRRIQVSSGVRRLLLKLVVERKKHIQKVKLPTDWFQTSPVGMRNGPWLTEWNYFYELHLECLNSFWRATYICLQHILDGSWWPSNWVDISCG